MDKDDINNPKLDEQASDDDATLSDTTETAPSVKVDLSELPAATTESSGFDVSNMEATETDLNAETAPEFTPTGRRKKSEGEKFAAKQRRDAKKLELDKMLLSSATAETVVGTLDMLRDMLSGGTCPVNPQLREATLTAWTRYCIETGKEIPAWVMVAVMSANYVAPALNTEPSKQLFSGIKNKLGGMWVKWRG